MRNLHSDSDDSVRNFYQNFELTTRAIEQGVRRLIRIWVTLHNKELPAALIPIRILIDEIIRQAATKLLVFSSYLTRNLRFVTSRFPFLPHNFWKFS